MNSHCAGSPQWSACDRIRRASTRIPGPSPSRRRAAASTQPQGLAPAIDASASTSSTDVLEVADGGDDCDGRDARSAIFNERSLECVDAQAELVVGWDAAQSLMAQAERDHRFIDGAMRVLEA